MFKNHFQTSTFLALTSFASIVYGQVQTKQSIEIPMPIGATLDDQDERSIDFEAPPGKGYAIVKTWISQFKELGWKVKIQDEELPEDGEYELTKGNLKLEIEFDDPGFGPADIEVSCGSLFLIELAGTKSAKAPSMQKTETISKAKSTNPSSVTKSSVLPSGRILTETKLGNVSDVNFDLKEGQQPSWWVSPNGRRFAHVVGLNSAISIDGARYDVMPTDDTFTFSPDSQHYAVAIQPDSGPAIMIDGEIKKLSVESILPPIIFSPDSQHVACFAVNKSGAHELLIDGISRGSWPFVSRQLAFSSDSKAVLFSHRKDFEESMRSQPVAPNVAGTDLGHSPAASDDLFFYGPKSKVGYIAKFGDHDFGVVYEGKEQGERLVDIRKKNVLVSGNGEHVAYMGDSSPIRNAIVFHGKKGIEHNPFEDGRIVDGQILISDDGMRMAYVLEKDGKQSVILDGQMGPFYEGISQLEFSPDSRQFAYLAMKEKSPVAVINGKETRQFAMVSLPTFSKNGKAMVYYAELSEKQFAVVNGAEQPSYDLVSDPLVSDDGSVVAYIAVSTKTVKGKVIETDQIIVNGKAQPAYELTALIGFYPGTNRLVYVANQAGRDCLVDDGKPTSFYDRIYQSISFSEDGKHMAFVARQGTKESVVVDGIEDLAYDFILLDKSMITKPVRFVAENSHSYLAVRDQELFLVDVATTKP